MLRPQFLNITGILFGLSLCSLHARAAPQDESRSTLTRVYDKASIFRKEDARLEKKINVDRTQIYAGELLEILATQTGISIEANDADGAASEELVAVLKDIPLADAMECLTSLLSHKNTRWQWRREGNGRDKPFVYRLMRPEKSIVLYAEQAKTQIQADLENEAEVMISGLDMSPEELAKKAKDNPRLNLLASDKATPLGIQAFRDCFTPEQRLSILRKENSNGVSVPLDKLPSSARQLEAYMHDKTQSLNPNTNFNVSSAEFYLSNNDFPRLVIQFGDLGGWGYLGGKTLQDKFIKREGDGWLQDNETKIDPALETQTLPKPMNRERTDSYPGTNQMPGRIAYLGEAGTFSVLARLERDRSGSSSDEPWQSTVGTFLDGQEASYSLMHKWHKNADKNVVLLVDYMSWFRQDMDLEHPRLPWKVVKFFRQADIEGTNESLLSAMLYSASLMNSNKQQLRLAKRDYPIAQWISSNHVWFQPLAQFIEEKPNRYALLISKGMPLKAMPNDLGMGLMNIKSSPDEAKMVTIYGSVRIVILPDGTGTDSFRLEVMDDKGNVRTVVSAPNWKTGNTRSKN